MRAIRIQLITDKVLRSESRKTRTVIYLSYAMGLIAGVVLVSLLLAGQKEI
jgi:hypothetical protein